MSVWIVILAFQFLCHTTLGEIAYCEKSCPANEVYAAKVSHCKNTCYNQNFNTTANCIMGPGCVCKQGFMRNQDTYKCIPIGTCLDKRSSKQCADNEFWSDCDAGCQRTCQTKGPKQNCGCISGCACRTGYVRNYVDFQCIPENLCQSNLNVDFLWPLMTSNFFKVVHCPTCILRKQRAVSGIAKFAVQMKFIRVVELANQLAQAHRAVRAERNVQKVAFASQALSETQSTIPVFA
jgi:Trypsin Inhibitor like cysteine rich domain